LKAKINWILFEIVALVVVYMAADVTNLNRSRWWMLVIALAFYGLANHEQGALKR